MSSKPELNRRELDWTRLDDLTEVVADAMKRGVRNAIAEHHRAGRPVPIGRNGHIVLLHPDGSERPLPDTAGKPTSVTE